MAEWTDAYWWSRDGLRLHYRDYAGPSDRPPLLCMPGLTRNARDFAGLADVFAGQWRVLCVDLRGRGDSAYAKDPMTYAPLTYLQDIEALLADQQLKQVVCVGTSLGGILTMLLAAHSRERIAGALLNDIGPLIEPGGLTRIRGFVGRAQNFPTWLHAARAIEEINAAVHPHYAIEDWLTMAKRLCRLTASGRIVFDYDPRLAEPFKMPGGEAGVDLWPAFSALDGVPGLVVRGALSDILSVATADEMLRRAPSFELLTVANVGHIPTLVEPEVVAATEQLLGRVLAAG